MLYRVDSAFYDIPISLYLKELYTKYKSGIIIELIKVICQVVSSMFYEKYYISML